MILAGSRPKFRSGFRSRKAEQVRGSWVCSMVISHEPALSNLQCPPGSAPANPSASGLPFPV
ncbi:hypothetical protein MA16_Dca021967 [Dendrobium catenatum]|uniref:Uncharacterized protein n=1 Tax=Dendrobium catenatum TaxID=906689 RepID=A0A2I0X469_9ASPA|nr:hypothetical protein MA16_Dca021967 [Dendrobium catenatum]